MTSTIHPVDEILPIRQMLALGLQHMAVAYVGAIAVPLIVASALGLSHADKVVLISATIFCSGLASLLQTIGVWKLGVRLPILQGVAFSSVAPVIAIGTMPGVGIAGICGAIIGAGAICVLLAPFIGRLRRLFPPVVIGCIVTVVGLQLLPVAYNWVGGGRGVDNFGAPTFLMVTTVVLVTILLVCRFGSPLMRNLAVLIGLVVGGALGMALDMGDFQRVQEAPWVSVPTPLYFGIPTFAIIPIVTILVVMIVQTVEGMGLFIAVGDMVEKPVKEKQLVAGLRADALSSVMAGFFAAFPFIGLMQNIGLILLTGVRSRWVVAVSGALMCVVALIPKAGAIIASVPSAALGGAGVAMFGVVIVAGIQTLGKVDYTDNRYNALIVSFSLTAALVPVVSPLLFKQMPEWTEPFLHSSVIIACLVSVLLNSLLNGLDDVEEKAHEPLVQNS